MDAAVIRTSSGIDMASEPPFRVGNARVDPASRDVVFSGTSERLSPQNLKVLIALTRHCGAVVTRDELISLCWDGRFVGDDVLNRAISVLRQFAQRAGGFEIQTVPRSGYRLFETSRSKKLHTGIAAGVAALVLLSAAAVWVGYGQKSAAYAPPTIAILPFNAISADPLAREVAAAAHDALAQSLSHTEFPVKLVDAPPGPGTSIADFLITADAETAADRATVTVRMEEGAGRVVVYSKRFEASRNDATALAEQVSGQVAGSISWSVSELALDKRHHTEPAIVAELFGNSDQFGDLGALPGYATSRRLALRAPDSAIAQDVLAFNAAFALQDLPRDQRAEALTLGRAAAIRSRAIAPEARIYDLSWCLLHSPVWIGVCEDHLRLAMRAAPDLPFADTFLAESLKKAGRLGEATDLARHSLARDSYVPGKIALSLRLLEATGERNIAKALYQQAQRWWPNNSDIFFDRLYGMAVRGDLEAIARFADEAGRPNYVTAKELVGDLPAAIARNDLVAAKRMCPLTLPPSPRHDFCMLAFAQLNDVDDAFALAERTFTDRLGHSPADAERIFLDRPWVPGTDILTGPATASMRRDPRFLELARRVGLLAYWRSGRLPDFCTKGHEPICTKLTAVHQGRSGSA